MAAGLPKGEIIFKQMKQISLKMKLILVLITCMAILDIYDEKILGLFRIKEDGFGEFILDTGSSCVQIVLILWVFILGKQAIQRHQEKEEHYRNLIERFPEAIFVHRRGEIIFTNKAGVRLLGANSMNDLLNHNWKNYIHYTPEELNLIKKKLNEDRIINFQIKAKRLDGQLIDLEITSTSIEFEGVSAREFIARDITKRKKQENMIQKLVYQDTLTKLPNRRAFMDKLEQSLILSQKNKTNLAVMFIDLDGFKKVNDNLGHDTGDELLKRVSALLKDCVRNNDFVARLAGDEFTILLPEANKQDSSLIADKIIKKLNVPIYILGEKVQVTSSIGISLYPQNGNDATVLIKKADESMYQAKNNGKNSYEFAEVSTDVSEREM
ncbi:sensor domain-containing diguanylate cyclase [Bacillus sp. B190/17]|uniref:Sensor domain-containing diguanylate cyclase n=1 Tax=Bacillus lumedeiriae TaxID=3058829 RepID=A0ABW8ICE8_9BACI